MRKLIWAAIGAMVCLLSIPSSMAQGALKVLYIDSYHQGYQWSDGIKLGIKSRLTVDDIRLGIHYMDAKRHSTESEIEASVQRTLAVIEQSQPDVVIVSDDIAVKYILQNHFKNADLPFVFCGVNWDASVYGLPYDNATGVIESTHITSVVDLLGNHAKDDRLGVLSIDALSERRSEQHYQQLPDLNVVKSYFVEDMVQWEAAFVQLQQEVDMIFLENPQGIAGWDSARAEEFVHQHALIPVGSTYTWLAPLSLFTIANIPQEQGWWAAELAMQLLDGAAPSELKVTKNQGGKLLANIDLAQTLGIQLTPEILQTATIVTQ